MKTNYDDETIDALIAASLRPQKQEPTDEQIEEIFAQPKEMSNGDEAIFDSARQKLELSLSGSGADSTSSPIDVKQSEYAAMNRENADNEFDGEMSDAIDEARRKALEELREEVGDNDAETEDQND